MLRKIVHLSLISLLCLPFAANAESVAEKAAEKRNELIRYLREIRTMSYNFPCDPYPDCMAAVPQSQPQAQPGAPAAPAGQKALPERIKLFGDIKRIYQEGMVYLYEGNYVNSYSRLLDSQLRVEQLLEGLSQLYLDRTEAFLRDAIEKRDPNDPADMSATDISIDYGPNSDKRRDFKRNREIPRDLRAYDPREAHYAYNKYEIERNVAMGYKHLGLAREARRRALTVDSNLAPQQRIEPHHRKLRIEFYLDCIRMARLAKLNGEKIYQLKYPYDNYALISPFGKSEKIEGDNPRQPSFPVIAGQERDWSTDENTTDANKKADKSNPYIFPANMNPVFDLRVPEKYRRDASDARDQIYDDQIDINVNYRYNPARRTQASQQDKKP